jgi:hypothetical protein
MATMNKPHYRYWESDFHPQYRKAWYLVGGTNEWKRRVMARCPVPLMLTVKGGWRMPVVPARTRRALPSPTQKFRT